MHLQAGMPPAPTTARGHMDVRIARKVAALTGIAGPPDASADAGHGQAWFSDYRLLTTTELSLGAPVRAGRTPEGPDGVVDAGVYRRSGATFTSPTGEAPSPLPSVTLQEYGPDTKAALVLTGVNHILRPVADAVVEVLRDTRRRIDDECQLVAVTQALLQEVLEAQPLVLLHGAQAAMIQRALLLSDAVHSPTGARTRPTAVARIEHGWPHADTARRQPDQLAVLWMAWDTVVGRRSDERHDDIGKDGAYLAFRRLDGFEQDHGFTVTGGPEARDDWVAILRDVSESHLLGTSPGLPRTAAQVFRNADESHAVAVIARERQIELMLARLAPRLLPLRTTPDGQRQVTLAPFDAARWADAPLIVRRTALLAQYYSIRSAGWLAGMKDLNRRRHRPTCAVRFAELARAAEELLVADDPLRTQLRVQGRAYVLQYSACRGLLDHDVYRQIVADLDRLVALTGAGRYPESQLVEHLQIVLVELGTYRSAVQWFGDGEPSVAVTTEITADLSRLWTVARGVRDRLLSDIEDADLRYLDHDYAGFLTTDPAKGPHVADGIRILDEVVARARRNRAEEGGRRALRLSRQVLLRALRTGLDARLGPEGVRRSWARKAWAVAVELTADPETAALVEQRDAGLVDGFDNSVLILLMRIAEGRVAALSSDLLPDVADGEVEVTEQAVRRAVAYAAAASRSVAADDSPVDALRVLQLRELDERWQTWRRGRAPSSAVVSPRTPEGPPHHH